jgi:glycosyltransferase involved in cell wall biosynthesis
MKQIKKEKQSNILNPIFSILIPTWNNLAYLQLCIKSIRKNAHFEHQIIVIINEGKDGTLEWVKTQTDLDYIFSNENLGICFGLNAARSLVQANYVCYMNDDMYACPNWDLPLKNEIDGIGHDYFFLSGTMIEPTDTNNPCVIVDPYGTDIDTFEEKLLLKNYKKNTKKDWKGGTWPPNVLHRDLWDLVGGMSVEFSPGMYSDPDLSRKLWAVGVRHFKGLGESRVYHFGSKSTGKVKHNKGKKAFLMKWGVSSRDFTNRTLERGEDFEEMNQNIEPTKNIKSKFKQILAILSKDT